MRKGIPLYPCAGLPLYTLSAARNFAPFKRRLKEQFMKKLICLLLTVLMLVSLTACAGGWKSTVTDYEAGTVSNNGGYAVVKGDYVYYINGKEESTADNAFGKVVKGALVRTKVADLATAAKATKDTEKVKSEIVIPKLIYTDYRDNGSGFYIFGNYVYYVTPSTELNKKGEVQNTVAEFTRTRLDGTDTKVIATAEGLSTPFRFVEGEDKKVYLTIYTTNSDDKNVLITYDDDGKKVSESEAVSSYVFSTDNAAKYAFYEKKPHNEVLDSDESFSEVHRYSLTDDKDEIVLYGAGKYSDNEGIGSTGVTFAFRAYVGENLYMSETYVDTSIVTVTRYFAVKPATLTAAVTDGKLDVKKAVANYEARTRLDNGSSSASTVFADTSVYLAPNCILYNDASYGIMKYDYNAKGDDASFGRIKVYYNKDLAGYTYKYNDGAYMYYTDDTYLYRVAIADLVDAANGYKVIANPDTIKVEKLNHYSNGTLLDWYKPEFVNNYMLLINTNDPYYGYLYVVDLNETKEMDKDAMSDYEDELNTLDREHILAKSNRMIGVMTDTDKEAFTKYLDGTYPEKDSSSSGN